MGLNNGIRVSAKTMVGENFLNNFGSYYNITEHQGEYELADWRKCWNIRNEILDAFSQQSKDDYGIILKISDLFKIKKIVTFFLDQETWDNTYYGSSIWTWEESLPNNAQIIFILTKFLEEIEEDDITDKDIKIEFYDSY